jgi:hypothetical protein
LRLRSIFTSPSASDSLAAAAEICEQHYDKMRGEPDVVVTHILKNVDQDQDTRSKYSQEYVRPIRDGVCREGTLKKVHEHYDSRKKQRKKQKIEIHILSPYVDDNPFLPTETIYLEQGVRRSTKFPLK